jgi:hypothetical protein
MNQTRKDGAPVMPRAFRWILWENRERLEHLAQMVSLLGTGAHLSGKRVNQGCGLLRVCHYSEAMPRGRTISVRTGSFVSYRGRCRAYILRPS